EGDGRPVVAAAPVGDGNAGHLAVGKVQPDTHGADQLVGAVVSPPGEATQVLGRGIMDRLAGQRRVIDPGDYAVAGAQVGPGEVAGAVLLGATVVLGAAEDDVVDGVVADRVELDDAQVAVDGTPFRGGAVGVGEPVDAAVVHFKDVALEVEDH